MLLRRIGKPGGTLTGAWTLLIALLLFLARTAFAAPAGTTTGELLQPQGRVEVLRVGTTVWLHVTNTTVLNPGDAVRTGPSSRASVRLGNDSLVRLDERSQLQLRPSRQPGGTLLNLLRGASYFFHRERPVRTEFETPLVSGAVRGTEFTLSVEDSGRSVLSLIDGAVDLTNALGALTMTSGEQAVIEPQQPPRRTAVIELRSAIQWCLYYPAVLDLDTIPFTSIERQALARSLAAYRAGDLLEAVAQYPEARAPGSDAERVYLAALQLAAGGVAGAQQLLATRATLTNAALVDAAESLSMLMAVVTSENAVPVRGGESASILLAASYAHQAGADLDAALATARQATERSPNFAFAWARLAELEFSFGHRAAARSAVERALQLAPRHAQAHVVRGFLLADAHQVREALAAFDEAIRIDAALGNAWLGRGLCRIRRGDSRAGLADLLVAAALEPNRAVLRSYLGKAFHHAGDDTLAARELDLARHLDAHDPTAWLYSALLNQQRHLINDAIRDLETSRELNASRGVYRSRLLLDQDQAVRRASLANIYRDAGMEDVAAREAVRAVNDDYVNHSAHLFLAESYQLPAWPGQSALRHETAAFSELLLANLLAPPGAGLLSRNISQGEYSRLFERDGPGIVSATEYRSNGDWLQNASQFGTFGGFSYALDASYFSRSGDRPNNDFEFLGLAGAFKTRINEHDSLYLQTIYSDAESGDVRQLYDPSEVNRTLRLRDTQAANVFAGWHREWHPQSHTLFLVGHLRDEYRAEDGAFNALTIINTNGVPSSVVPPAFGFWSFDSRLRQEFRAWSAEGQQIWQRNGHTVIAGARHQAGETDTRSTLLKLPAQIANYPTGPQTTTTDLERTTLYLYETWRATDWLSLAGGLTYDRLRFPENIDLAPVSVGERSEDQWSPKLAVTWTPDDVTAARVAWTRSLGGLYYDNSVRLEPAQFGGFVQAYRSLIPDSLVGSVAGTSFETWSAEVEHRFPTRTYLGLRGEQLESEARRNLGVFDIEALDDPTVALPGSTRETLDYRERALLFTANQLVSRDWSFGLRYRLAEAELEEQLVDIPVTMLAAARNDHRALLHQLWMNVNFNHPSGAHAEFQALWHSQENSGYTPARAGDDLWQFNILAGWRLWRRHADVTLGVLNLTDEDYRLNPLSLHGELPRERTFVAAVRLAF